MKTTILTCVLVLIYFQTALGQMVRIAPLQVVSSTLTEQIKALKAANPKISADDFAKSADAILQRDGVNAAISFDTATCEKIRKVRDGQKDLTAPVHLNANLKSVDADAASLRLPDAQFASDDCGGCFVEIPVLQLTSSDFVTRVSGQNIKFALPGSFSANEIDLIEPKDSQIKRRWLIPFRATPIGVSSDQNVIYLGFDDPELADLSLLVFSEGAFQIGTRKDAEDGGPGKVAADPWNGSFKLITFDRWKTISVLRYKDPCQLK